nr:MAG TPA: hypothetical protein [Caudoviricetes sp.]
MDIQEFMLWLQTTIIGINASNLDINKRILELAEKDSNNFKELKKYLENISNKLDKLVDEK